MKPRTQINVRVRQSTLDKLGKITGSEEISQAEAIRRGIELYYNEVMQYKTRTWAEGCPIPESDEPEEEEHHPDDGEKHPYNCDCPRCDYQAGLEYAQRTGRHHPDCQCSRCTQGSESHPWISYPGPSEY